MSSNEIEKTILQEWLEKLQEESWQLELLISGFAIFGLFELDSFLIQKASLQTANFHPDPTLIVSTVLISGAYLATQIFIINLLTHVVIRGLWIGAIGLRYVSGEIDYDSLKYNERFINYYKRKVGRFDDYIIKLEKFASLIFSYTFLLFFITISVFIFFVEIMLVVSILKRIEKLGIITNNGWVRRGFLLVFIGAGIIVALDFLTLGLLKRIKQRHFSKFYLVVYKVIGYATLSFLWRPILLNFLDQKETKRLLFFILPYISIVIFIIPNSKIFEYKFFPLISDNINQLYYSSDQSMINKHSYNRNFYDTVTSGVSGDNEYDNIRILSIPSIKVKGALFEVFIKYDSESDYYISTKDTSVVEISEVGYRNSSFSQNKVEFSDANEKIISEKIDSLNQILDQVKNDELEKITLLNRDSLKMVLRNRKEYNYEQNLIRIKELFLNSFQLSIDDNIIPKEEISLDFYIHPNRNEKGMLCFFPIDLKLGRHILTYEKKIIKRKVYQNLDVLSVAIPFIYEGK